MKLIFGCGYLGGRVAQLWKNQGEPVAAVTRSADRAHKLAQLGIESIVADVTDEKALREKLPKNVTTVLYAIGFDRSSGHSMRAVYVDGLNNVLDALLPTVEKIIYISSTGVFGDFSGEWIDESSPCRPDREGGRVCLAAEELLAAHTLGQRSVVLRMAGIYGPGRIPRRKELIAGEPIAAPEQGWLNLIHVEDAAQVVIAAEKLSCPPPRMYLATDGHPVLRGDYFRELAKILSAPSPTFMSANPSSPAADRAASSKRIRIAKLLADLPLDFAYPSYREGLASSVVSENQTAGL